MNLTPFKLERYFTQYEHTAKYSLCNSDCESMSIRELLNFEPESRERFEQVWLGYTHTKGAQDLREQISNIYNRVSDENILVCTGAQEPIFLFSQALLSREDEVIVQTPCYQSLESIPQSIGCKVLSWNVRYRDGAHHFDLNELSELITEQTKIIYLNTPHNPTGYLFTKEEQKEIIRLAKEKDIIVFCDEVYRELEYDPSDALPTIADAYENGVSIGVMSKTYGLPGLRIGWMTSQNSTILEKVAVLKEYTTICNAAPSEFLATLALRNRGKILERNIGIIKTNLELYVRFFAKYGDLFSWHKPTAGPISLVKMNFDEDDFQFAQRVRKEYDVLLLPGSIYDFKGYFRIGLGRKGISPALNEFEKFVEKEVVLNI